MSEENLKNPPIGDNVRQPKPWEALGMSRATWFRHGKPTYNDRKITQKNRAEWGWGVSTRTVQREDFVKRYGIPELEWLILNDYFLAPGMVEEIAKWEHEDQRTFLKKLTEALEAAPKVRTTEPRPKWLRERPKIGALCHEVSKADLRRAAKRIFTECQWNWWHHE